MNAIYNIRGVIHLTNGAVTNMQVTF